MIQQNNEDVLNHDFEDNVEISSTVGKKRYGRLVRLFREGYLSLCIYKNVYEKRVYFDIVLYRKIRTNGKAEYKRGANLKPDDLPILSKLLQDAQDFLQSCQNES